MGGGSWAGQREEASGRGRGRRLVGGAEGGQATWGSSLRAKEYMYIYIYGTVHAKLAYHVFIYKVIKMIHFEIATSPEP